MTAHAVRRWIPLHAWNEEDRIGSPRIADMKADEHSPIGSWIVDRARRYFFHACPTSLMLSPCTYCLRPLQHGHVFNAALQRSTRWANSPHEHVVETGSSQDLILWSSQDLILFVWCAVRLVVVCLVVWFVWWWGVGGLVGYQYPPGCFGEGETGGVGYPPGSELWRKNERQACL